MINTTTYDTQIFLKRIKLLGCYINWTLLASKLLTQKEGKLQNIRKDEFRWLYLGIKYWALDDNHKFKQFMNTCFKIGEKYTGEIIEKELKEKIKKRKHPSVSYELAEQIFQKTGIEVRITVPGHTQRGGSPCPYDRVLSTRLGAEAATLIMKKEYGYMVGIINGKVKKVPLGDVAGKLKMVSPDDQLIKEAKCIGISFGV